MEFPIKKIQGLNKVKFIIFGILVLVGIWFLKFNTTVLAVTESDCLNKDVSQLTPSEMDECINTILPRIASAYAPAQQKNKEDLAALSKQLTDLNSRIVSLGKQLVSLEKQILGREEDLAFTKEIFDEKAKEHYTFLRLYDPITPFLFSDSASQAFQEITLRQRAADQDRKTMEQYASDLSALNSDKESLTKNKASLSSLQSQVSEKQKFLAGEVAKVDSYLNTLSAKQNELAAAKAGGFSTTVGDVPTSAEPCSGKPGASNFCDPGFRPAFAAFSYGAPHRKGMSQYGAYGRAKSGQSAEDILHAYYGGIEIKKDYSTSININVQGYGAVNIETYVKRIYEMPASWTANDSAALKAQAVAARSYALAYTNNGANEICTTQACQVYKGGNKGGNWENAVRETSGEVIMHNGEVVKAWYASTFGGYSFTSGDVWGSDRGYTKRMRDTNGDISSFTDLTDRAYDHESPCFYAAQGFRTEYAKSAWLKDDEVADIVNVLLLAKSDSSTQQHLSQTDKSNPDGTDTWDSGRVKNELKARGGTPYNSISEVSVDWDKGTGRVTSVRVSGDAGTNSFDGSEFKNFFNLRAPANIQIVGPLYNTERK